MPTVTVAEACAALHVSARTLRRLLAAGELVGAKTGPGRTCSIEVDPESIRAYLSRCTVAGS